MILKYQIIKNSFSNFIQFIVTVISGLFLPPFILSKLGINTYGLWVLILAITSYLKLLDLGTFSSLTKFLTESLSDNEALVLKYFSSLFIIVFFGGLTAILVSMTVPKAILVLFLSSSSMPVNIDKILIGFMIVTVMSLLSDLFGCLIIARQRIDSLNYINIISVIINIALVVFFLMIRWGLMGILVSQLISLTVRLSLVLYIIKKSYQSFNLLELFVFEPSFFKEIIKLSRADQSMRITGIILGPMNKFLIQWFAGPSFLTFYDLSIRVVSQISTVPTMMFNPIIPAVAELNSKGEKDSINTLLSKSIYYLILIGMPIYFFVFIFSDSLINVWLGKPYEIVVLTIHILLVSSFLNLLSGPFYYTQIGLGDPKLGTVKTVLTFFLNIILTFVLILLGKSYYGIILGEAIAISLGSLYYLFNFGKKYKMKLFFTMWKSIFNSLLLVLLSCFIILALFHYSQGIINWMSLFSWGVVFAIYYSIIAILYYKFKMIGVYEWDLIRSIIFNK
ncbi:MAG: MATE family efflux transporter [Ignavibacteriaceae bacterium]